MSNTQAERVEALVRELEQSGRQVSFDVRSAITSLVAENEALRADAERYWWLRDENSAHYSPRIDPADGMRWSLTFYTPAFIADDSDDENMDAAIDAARNTTQQQGG